MIGRKNDWSEKDIDCAFLPEEGEKGDKDHKRFHDRFTSTTRWYHDRGRDNVWITASRPYRSHLIFKGGRRLTFRKCFSPFLSSARLLSPRLNRRKKLKKREREEGARFLWKLPPGYYLSAVTCGLPLQRFLFNSPPASYHLFYFIFLANLFPYFPYFA